MRRLSGAVSPSSTWPTKSIVSSDSNCAEATGSKMVALGEVLYTATPFSELHPMASALMMSPYLTAIPFRS
jgi:hypothetical protein